MAESKFDCLCCRVSTGIEHDKLQEAGKTRDFCPTAHRMTRLLVTDDSAYVAGMAITNGIDQHERRSACVATPAGKSGSPAMMILC